jgi:hypothetical protein
MNRALLPGCSEQSGRLSFEMDGGRERGRARFRRVRPDGRTLKDYEVLIELTNRNAVPWVRSEVQNIPRIQMLAQFLGQPKKSGYY